MLPAHLQDRLEALTDELMRCDDIDAAFLAAILLRVGQAAKQGNLPALCHRLWQDDQPLPTKMPQPPRSG